MFIETRKQGNSKKYYLINSYRLEGKVKRISIYLGSNLSNEELEKSRKTAENKLIEQIKKKKIRSFMKKERLFKTIVRNLKKQGAKKISVFGSYARNEEKKDSDIDLLVDFEKKKSLLELVGIEQNLSETIGKKIDLLSEDSISKHILDNVKKDIKRIY